jgi:UDP-N-acetylmuramoylalanine--D-glutamate ligase
LEKPVVLIAGGQGKGQDFAPLVHALKHKARAVVLLGQDAVLLQQSFEGHGIECLRVASMQEAVAKAFEQAKPGDAVLLSPACASFDMFTGYGQRGMQFMDEVAELALSLGEVA